MSILKTIYLQHLNGAAPNATLDANGNMTVTGTVVSSSPTGGMRNKIINGDMRIDQRNAGANVVQSGTSGNYTLDRWQNFFSQTSKYSIQRSSSAPSGFSNSILITSLASTALSSGDYFMFSQSIEGFNISDLAWGTSSAKPVTLSFWVQSSLTGTFSGAISNIWSTGGRYYVYTYTINAANTWQYVTVTIPGDVAGSWSTSNTLGLIVSFSLGVGTAYSGSAGSWGSTYIFNSTGSQSVVSTNGATFYITGVQLEAGTIATPFERRQYGTELSLCQRYFQTTYESGTALGTATRTGLVGGTTATYATAWYAISGSFNLPVPMRVTPTVNYWDGAGNAGKYSYIVNSTWTDNQAAVGTAATFALTSRSAFFSGTTGSVAPWSIYVHYGASAEL